jgi:aryl-alcohol dehydrogenase-like predicted oxidoreductase
LPVLGGADASRYPAQSSAELRSAVHDNLRNLGVDALDAVNVRTMGNVHAPAEGSIEAPFTALAELPQRGLIQHLGVSNVTSTQVAKAPCHAAVTRLKDVRQSAWRRQACGGSTQDSRSEAAALFNSGAFSCTGATRSDARH